MPIIANDAATIPSILTFAGGALGFLGAVIAFINSRLKRAKTVEARYSLYINLLSFLECSLWIGAFLAAIAFGSLRVGLWFMIFAYIIHCALFLVGRTNYVRIEVLMLALCTGFLVFMSLGYLIERIVDAQTHMIETESRMTDILKKLTNTP
jgi:hypothetical protein